MQSENLELKVEDAVQIVGSIFVFFSPIYCKESTYVYDV